jgi:gliding motility-associated transport system permease protein
MRNVLVVFRREFAAYFTTPLAYVFLVVFLALAGALTFYIGNFFEREQADLEPFFTFHPWLYLFLIPAISMRLWAEERKTGTIELLLTLPISISEAVLGKYLAAWAFTGVALILTFPMWVTVNVLGRPDNGVILTGYLGSFVMAGAFLAIGACMSALTKNQVIAFVVACAACFLFILSGTPMVLNFVESWLPQVLVDAIASFSFLTHFNAIKRGIIDLRDVIFLASLIGLFLCANTVLVDLRKAA